MKIVSNLETTEKQPSKARVRGVSKNSMLARRKIIDSATLVFGKYGFANAKTEEIAEQAGYGQATVFFHFKTKLGLLEACLEEGLARSKANLILSENSGTIDFIQRLDRAFDNSATADLFARMLVEFSDNSTIRPVYADFHEHLRQLISNELVSETGATERRAYIAASSILAMMVGVHAEQKLENKRLTRADFRAMLISVTRLVLLDLTKPEGSGE